MFKLHYLLIGCLSLSIALIACLSSGQATPIPSDQPTSAGPDQTEQPEAVQAALRALVEAKGVRADEISVVSVEAVEWNDACLGLAGPDEMCAQVITPGYRIILEVKGEEFEFHTDATGQTVRQK